MILQMLPEQVVAKWDYLEALFLSSLPVQYQTEHSAVSMLKAILMEDCQVWQIISDEQEVLGYGITHLKVDSIIDMRYLFLYLLVAENVVSVPMWKDALQALKNYARSRACVSVQAITVIEEVKRLASMLGGSNEQTLIEFGVV